MEENFTPKRKTAHESIADIPKELPPALAVALGKNQRSQSTGNNKLDFLLDGLKESLHSYEEILLPSKGKFYTGEDLPADGILHVRVMTGEEEQVLATQRLVKNGQAMNIIFKNCVRENIDPNKMLAVDRTYLLIYLRGISHGNIYNTDVRCSECQNRFETVIDLDDLELTRCPDDFGPESLKGVLPKSGYRFTYRLATGKDEQLIQDYRDRKVKKSTDNSDDTWAYRFSLLINEIENMDDKPSIQTLVSKLSVADIGYLRGCLNEPPFGVNTDIELFCPNGGCGSMSVSLPYSIDFFYPVTPKTPVS